ncbi:hypothetical protein SHM7688_00040 [Shimia marina]|uniref:Uncharacterized protein n=1 Tax=Shimia marina TaxID=321267 RepID=A0A0P1EK54_9RHOB|nr:hypothetical protein SHM7688_00040 [Shimia marina]
MPGAPRWGEIAHMWPRALGVMDDNLDWGVAGRRAHA